MAKEPVLLVAAGGLARETLSAIREGDSLEPLGVLDDDPAHRDGMVGGVPVLGTVDDVADFPEARLLVCAGSGLVRESIIERLTVLGVDRNRYATVVHPAASVGDGCVIGDGSVLLAGVVLTSDVTVGEHVVVMPHTTLTHDVTVEDFGTLCAGVSLGGSVVVGRGAYLGMNSSVRQGLRVGSRATLGMGSVLLENLPHDETWIGVPARSTGNVSRQFRQAVRGA